MQQQREFGRIFGLHPSLLPICPLFRCFCAWRCDSLAETSAGPGGGAAVLDTEELGRVLEQSGGWRSEEQQLEQAIALSQQVIAPHTVKWTYVKFIIEF